MIKKVKTWISNSEEQFVLRTYDSATFGKKIYVAERIKDNVAFMIGDLIYDRTIKQSGIICNFNIDCVRIDLSRPNDENDYFATTEINNIAFDNNSPMHDDQSKFDEEQ